MAPQVWKVLFEGYEGPDWLIFLVVGNETTHAPLTQSHVLEDAPNAINIPSPCFGEGGYCASKFNDYPVVSAAEEIKKNDSTLKVIGSSGLTLKLCFHQRYN